MYVCIYLYMNVRTYVGMYVCMYIWMYVSMYVCMNCMHDFVYLSLNKNPCSKLSLKKLQLYLLYLGIVKRLTCSNCQQQKQTSVACHY